MIARYNVVAGGSVHLNIQGPRYVDLVDAGGRNMAFLVEGDPNPQAAIIVEKGHVWGGNLYNTQSGSAAAPVAGTFREMPLGLSLKPWGGQIGQGQPFAMLLDVNGNWNCNQDDFVVPPDAQGMRVFVDYVRTGVGAQIGFQNGCLIEFGVPGAGQNVPVPVGYGSVEVPLYDRVFQIGGGTILEDGSDHCAGNDVLNVIVSFLTTSPVRVSVTNWQWDFYDETNIAQATTYFFITPVFYLGRMKRWTLDFTFAFEDDANTAGGSVNFAPADLATAGGINYLTWAYPLGTDIGADRRGRQVMNVVDPSNDRCIISVTDSDAAKDVTVWYLRGRGVDDQ